MEKIENLAAGLCRVELTGADTARLINRLAGAGIGFWGAESVDALTVRISVKLRELKKVEAIAKRCQCEAKLLGKSGAPVLKRRLRHRLALIICAALFTLCVFISSFFVWDIEVRGNERVSTGALLRSLEECGVKIGAFWPSFTGDLIRNEMLLKLPELRWLAVNVDSSRAYVIVRERVDKPALINDTAPHDVIARQTGIIESVSCLQGVALVKKGDAVAAGETLVSGIFSSELTEDRYVHAQASVMARTYYELTAKAPLSAAEKEHTGARRTRFAVIFCGKRLNFYISSSKMGAGCDKIIREYPFAVRGVFTLPVTLVRESVSEYNIVLRERPVEDVRAELEAELLEELERRLGSKGELTSRNFTDNISGGALTVTLRAECLEDIAEERPISP